MKSYKRQIEALEQSIQKLVKLASKSKNSKHQQQKTNYEEVLPLLKKAIQKENEVQEVAIDEHIKAGYTSKLSMDATISPKHRDIKELQQFLSEDNIRDTNPILILSFKKLIGLTIDYLQNLERMLSVLGTHSHKDDRIGIGIRDAIVDLFKGNDANSYELNNHIRKTIGEQIDLVFNSRGIISLSDFCLGLAHGIRNELITPFQDTNKKALKKAYGKKFRKHKKSPYPFISKILTDIDLYDIPFDVEGDLRKEKLYTNLASWYSSFLQQLLKFEAETKVDFSNQALLKKTLTGFGNSLSLEVTPIACKTHLADNIVTSLGSNTTLKASDLAQKIKQELDFLRPSIKTLIDTGTFKGAEDLDNFLGIQPENYFDLIRTTLEENHFDEYKAIIKDWIKSADQLMNKLGVDRENGKYNYQSKVVVLNLSKLFNIEHNLLDFSSFVPPILDEIKATGFSLELTEIDTLFSNAIAKGTIYSTLIDLYNTSIEDGTFSDSFDTLETTLPSMDQLRYAILDAKINLILNRETKFLTLQYNFDWSNRSNIITMLIDTIVNKADIASLCENFIQIIEDATNNGGNGGNTPVPPVNSDSWKDWAKGILRSITELPQKIVDAIVTAIRDLLLGALQGISAVITQIRNFLQNQLSAGGALNIPERLSSTFTEINIPLSLSLEEDKNGDFLPYITIKSGTTHTGVWSIVRDENYYQLEATDLSNEIGNIKEKTIPTQLKLKLRFTDPGYSVSSDISAVFISAGISILEGEYDQDVELEFNFNSIYEKVNNQVILKDIVFSPINSISFEKAGVLNGNLLAPTSSSQLIKGLNTTVKAFV